jgi:hypothetical protein
MPWHWTRRPLLLAELDFCFGAAWMKGGMLDADFEAVTNNMGPTTSPDQLFLRLLIVDE